ncbi:MAG TPA: glycosyltransferase family 4 protein [Sporolactobacillaceae bacterium]|nr:glycosyltransferase family 4 protein [Sporolactobacillaceae bacterium]
MSANPARNTLSDAVAEVSARMRILFLNPSGLFGGAERSLLDIIASLKAARPDWEMRLVAGSDGPLIRRARAMNIVATVLPMPAALAQVGDSVVRETAGAIGARLSVAASLLNSALATNRYTRMLAREIEQIAPTLIYTNGFKMHVIGTWAARSKAPVVWHIHDYVGARPVMSRLMRRQASRCSAAITNSDSVRRDLGRVCEDRVAATTVYNAVDLEQFSPVGAAADLDALAGMATAPLGTVRVGLVATMARWKGHEVFLRAIAELPAASRSRMRAYVIGGAIYPTRGSQLSQDELRASADRLGISNCVGFTGFVDDVASAIRALDIVLHASTEPEPFGLAIIEAMACGKPVIVSAAGGAAEIAQLCGGAILYPPGDSAALAGCIERLIGNPSERANLGAAGRASAEKLFRRSRLADEIIPILERVSGANLRCA